MLRELMEGEWRELRSQTTYTPERFTPQLYQERVAGKPRFAGAMAVMESFGIPDPEAHAEDYGERKQQRIVDLAVAGEFTAFPDALRFVLPVRQSGTFPATASSSRNAKGSCAQSDSTRSPPSMTSATTSSGPE